MLKQIEGPDACCGEPDREERDLEARLMMERDQDADERSDDEGCGPHGAARFVSPSRYEQCAEAQELHRPRDPGAAPPLHGLCEAGGGELQQGRERQRASGRQVHLTKVEVRIRDSVRLEIDDQHQGREQSARDADGEPTTRRPSRSRPEERGRDRHRNEQRGTVEAGLERGRHCEAEQQEVAASTRGPGHDDSEESGCACGRVHSLGECVCSGSAHHRARAQAQEHEGRGSAPAKPR